jgi:quercetin dioxygenase-like cupin family protein
MSAQVLVTGLARNGQSTIESSGVVPDGQLSTIHRFPVPGQAGRDVKLLRFSLPARRENTEELDVPIHATATTDLIFVAEGPVELVTETVSKRVSTGDFVIIDGQAHGWRNVGDNVAVLIGVMVPTGSAQ